MAKSAGSTLGNNLMGGRKETVQVENKVDVSGEKKLAKIQQQQADIAADKDKAEKYRMIELPDDKIPLLNKVEDLIIDFSTYKGSTYNETRSAISSTIEKCFSRLKRVAQENEYSDLIAKWTEASKTTGDMFKDAINSSGITDSLKKGFGSALSPKGLFGKK